jgi:HAD superfamily hydrolase (TIGR01509 family)
MTEKLAFLFDLDGTLIDSVYQHVLAWHEAFDAAGIDLPVWRIHRRIGMSGGLTLRALGREIGMVVDAKMADSLAAAHRTAFLKFAPGVRPLPGASTLLSALSAAGIPWAIATSGDRIVANAGIARLELPQPPAVVITRSDVAHAKPNPDLFLAAAAGLNVDIRQSFVVGDSVWDLLAAQRAGALGIGVLSGGFGRSELERANAYRVFDDMSDLLARLDELGVRDVTPMK